VLKPHRSRILLASKGGLAGVTGSDGVTKRVIDGRPEAIRRNCEDSLKRLNTEVIDLYYLHRWDKRVPVEESIGALADLVRQGKVRALGLSEVSATTIRRAHRVHPIAAVQSEYSLWSRNVEIGVLQACREVGAAFVAFSPLARGFLTGAVRDVSGFDPKDIRRAMPRFEPATFASNLPLLDGFAALARDADCTMAQLALAWVLAQGDHVVALPGTTRLEHLLENLGAAPLTLSRDMLARADALINRHTVVGPRYSAANQLEVDTEEFEVARDP
jgi:aryl-alcohol dehydrogenase-like predicted oxidoreductase